MGESAARKLSAQEPIEFSQTTLKPAEAIDQFSKTTKNITRAAKLLETTAELAALVTGYDGLNNLAQGFNTARSFANPAYRLADAGNRWVNRKGMFDVVQVEGDDDVPVLQRRWALEALSIAAPLLLFVVTTLSFTKFLHKKRVFDLGNQSAAVGNALTWIGTPAEAVASLTEFTMAFYHGKQEGLIDAETSNLLERLHGEDDPREQAKLQDKIDQLKIASQANVNKQFEKLLGGTKYALGCLGRLVHRNSVPRVYQLLFDLIPRGMGVYQSCISLMGDYDLKKKRAALAERQAEAKGRAAAAQELTDFSSSEPLSSSCSDPLSGRRSEPASSRRSGLLKPTKSEPVLNPNKHHGSD